ncbi:type III secretion protein HrpG [Pseudomonas synxantha]|uniref:Type III secretion protein HrpG n=1 Tax=Pseudomonas synxantha TaxID=47883 RepID=A0A3G7U2J8_9PSED|nr:type III secretion system chaperone [Pseudomonas synxantha]AZE52902.1 type III secretion protein HrpG [Pseudomonas synxantha]
MHALIGGWLNSHEEQLKLFENDDEINLLRVSNKLLIEVQLTRTGADSASLRTWMRLGGPSLSYFQGALAQSPATGTLWLVQCVEMQHGEQPAKCLEFLLNQRDTWRAIVARQARPARAFVPTSLRSIPH